MAYSDNDGFRWNVCDLNSWVRWNLFQKKQTKKALCQEKKLIFPVSVCFIFYACTNRDSVLNTHTMTPCPQPIFTDALTVRRSNQTHIHPHIHTPTIHRVVQPPLQKSSTDSVHCLPAHDILWSHWLAGTQHGLGWLTAMLQLPNPWTWAQHLPQTTSKKATRERTTETTCKVTQPTLSALCNSTPGQWHPSYNEIPGMSRHEHSSKELTHKPKKIKRKRNVPKDKLL